MPANASSIARATVARRSSPAAPRIRTSSEARRAKVPGRGSVVWSDRVAEVTAVIVLLHASAGRIHRYGGLSLRLESGLLCSAPGRPAALVSLLAYGRTGAELCWSSMSYLEYLERAADEGPRFSGPWTHPPESTCERVARIERPNSG